MDHVFPFEQDEVGADLALVPLVARRALEHSGFQLPLAGWQSLPVDARQKLVSIGAQENVDTSAVAAIVDTARPNARHIDPGSDPPSTQLPDGLSDEYGVDTMRWSSLSGVARFVIAHAARRAMQRHDPTILTTAIEAFIARYTMPSLDQAQLTPPPPSRRFSTEPRSIRAEHLHFAIEQRPITSEPKSIRAAHMPQISIDRTLVSEKPILPPESSVPVPPAPKTMLPVPETVRPEPTPVANEHVHLSTHVGPSGDVRMVDVANKPTSHRTAVATCRVRMRLDTIDRLLRGDTPKGEVLATARIAGIMAAKRTPDLIPMCHSIALSHVEIRIDIDAFTASVKITAKAEAIDRTGVEMEALVAASVAGLTMYDMLKGIDKDMVLEQVMLIEKTGGRSGDFRRVV